MRVLVTGAAGFAGSHLCDHLVAEGATVFALVRPEANLERIRHLKGHVELLNADLANSSSVIDGVQRARADWVFHLAGHTLTSRIDLYRTNVLGTVNLLEAICAHSPRARVLVAGSSAQYGMIPTSEQPITEEAEFRPVNHYGSSKVAQEALAFQYAYSSGLEIVVARLFNQTGPRESAGLVCSDFAKQIAEAEAGLRLPTVHTGCLSTRRDFTDVRDGVRAYCQLLPLGRAGDAYNVCSGKAVTIREILNILVGLARVPVSVVEEVAEPKPMDVPIQIGSYRKLHQLTGWQPDIPLEQSLADLLDDWRDRVRLGNTVGGTPIL